MQIFDILDNFNEVPEDWKVGKSNYWILLDKFELDELKKKIVLDEESLEECITYGNTTSKIIFFDGYMFLSFNILGYKNGIVKSRELNIYLSKDYIVTLYNEEIGIIDELIKDIKDLKNCFLLKNNPRPSMILYYLIDRIILKNYNIMSKLEGKADEIEIAILKNPSREHAEDLIHLRRQLYKLRKYLNPLRYVGDSLVSNDNSIIDKEDISHFHSINMKINKLMLALESLVQDLALVREAFESEIGNKTNDFMKVFTIITSIFLPLNLITSLQGMNFEKMPLSSSPNGYYYILIIMILISATMLIFFKRNKWL